MGETTKVKVMAAENAEKAIIAVKKGVVMVRAVKAMVVTKVAKDMVYKAELSITKV